MQVHEVCPPADGNDAGGKAGGRQGVHAP
jgi:hypothetical protein